MPHFAVSKNLLILAESADSEDPKLAALLTQIQAVREREPRANILVYTEYSDSQKAVTEALQRACNAKAIAGEVLTIEGDDSDSVRGKRIERFGKEDVLILVSTDATAEGLNLHERCHHLIHVELPYNPNRLEQRNGRIDRYRQQHDPVVRYLYLAGTFEERVLLRLVAKYEKQRARLTFVPNTLGLVVNDQNLMTQKLLDGLVEEESSLFRRERQSDTLFELGDTKSDDLSSGAYQDLLLEMDRAISGFEKAANAHPWLIGEGVGAEDNRLQDAISARKLGSRLGGVNLDTFVREAVAAEARSATAVRDLGDAIMALELPPAWVHGLTDLPGFESESRRLLLTTDADVFSTKAGESVGYLGRAHPIVRRAIDRVRANAVGGEQQVLDRRVSAVEGNGPALLFTFLASVQSDLGREYERVVGIRLSPQGHPETLLDPSDWLGNVDRDRAVATKGLWEKHFASWAGAQEERCRLVAQAAFADVADEFCREFSKELDEERRQLTLWLQHRTKELCGERNAQLSFELPAAELPAWQTATDPVERLGALKADSCQPPWRRREADGVLQIYRSRSNQIDKRKQLVAMPIMTLGLLMVVPGGQG
ncbi:MAG: helicase-related protein [Polyangiaceae bacterium]